MWYSIHPLKAENHTVVYPDFLATVYLVLRGVLNVLGRDD